MAATKPFCAHALFILMIFAFETFASEGTPLVEDETKLCRRWLVGKGMVEGPIAPAAIHGDNAPMVDTSDARPTAPGHSPGAGHSFNHTNAVMINKKV